MGATPGTTIGGGGVTYRPNTSYNNPMMGPGPNSRVGYNNYGNANFNGAMGAGGAGAGAGAGAAIGSTNSRRKVTLKLVILGNSG